MRETIKIESELFEGLRERFNEVLQQTFSKMQQKNQEEASISLKVNLYLSHQTDDLDREYKSPFIDYEVGFAIKETGKSKGVVSSGRDKLKLEFDSTEMKWITDKAFDIQMKMEDFDNVE